MYAHAQSIAPPPTNKLEIARAESALAIESNHSALVQPMDNGIRELEDRCLNNATVLDHYTSRIFCRVGVHYLDLA